VFSGGLSVGKRTFGLPVRSFRVPRAADRSLSLKKAAGLFQQSEQHREGKK